MRTYYQPGYLIENAGLTIIKILVAGQTKDQTLYSVEYQCCGKVWRLTEKQINKRLYNTTTHCTRCGRRKSGEIRKKTWKVKLEKEGKKAYSRDYEPLEIPLPMWPVPTLAVDLAKERRVW